MSSEDKIREAVEAAERGDVAIGFTKVETTPSDDGRKIITTTRRLCTPCGSGRHGECDFMCNCNHPSHTRQDSNESLAATTAAQQHRPEQEAKPQPDDQQGTQPPTPT